LHIETKLSGWETLAMPRKPRRKGGSLKDGERRQIAYAARRGGMPPLQPPPATGTAIVLCDGGSRGNPGPAAIAAVLFGPDGGELARQVERIGRATAAEAEHRAIALGLDLAAAHGADPIEVRSDSQIAVAALSTDERFAEIRAHWHPRAENEIADALVREELWGRS
jgi:ribonuclease HI